MSLSQKFADFRKTLTRADRDLRAVAPVAPRPVRNRWNTIGRTRRKLAEMLTEQVRTLEAGGGGLAFPDAVVAPEDIRAMRLVGNVRAWEDAHSWEAYARWPDGTVCYSFFSYDNMTACVHAGRLHPIGKDGELSI